MISSILTRFNTFYSSAFIYHFSYFLKTFLADAMFHHTSIRFSLHRINPNLYQIHCKKLILLIDIFRHLFPLNSQMEKSIPIY